MVLITLSWSSWQHNLSIVGLSLVYRRRSQNTLTDVKTYFWLDINVTFVLEDLLSLVLVKFLLLWHVVVVFGTHACHLIRRYFTILNITILANFTSIFLGSSWMALNLRSAVRTYLSAWPLLDWWYGSVMIDTIAREAVFDCFWGKRLTGNPNLEDSSLNIVTDHFAVVILVGNSSSHYVWGSTIYVLFWLNNMVGYLDQRFTAVAAAEDSTLLRCGNPARMIRSEEQDHLVQLRFLLLSAYST